MDAREILLSDDKTQVLTQANGGFAERAAGLIHPLCNLKVYDADGNPLQVTYSKEDVVIVLRIASTADEAAPFRWFRGEYVANPVDASGQPDPYLAQQMVVVRGGSYAGTYVCVQSNPTLAPWQGVYWVNVAPANAIGRWL